jgi:hypothetical protein
MKSQTKVAFGIKTGSGKPIAAKNLTSREQIRAAVEAERKAQEAMLMAEQARMADLMQRERRELEQRLAEEKAVLEVRPRMLPRAATHRTWVGGQNPRPWPPPWARCPRRRRGSCCWGALDALGWTLHDQRSLSQE